MLPFIEQLLGRGEERLFGAGVSFASRPGGESEGMMPGAYSFLPRVGHVPVGLEEGADVQGLAPPDGAMHRPVKGELQRPAVQRPG